MSSKTNDWIGRIVKLLPQTPPDSDLVVMSNHETCSHCGHTRTSGIAVTYAGETIQAQLDDSESMINLVERLIELRARSSA